MRAPCEPVPGSPILSNSPEFRDMNYGSSGYPELPLFRARNSLPLPPPNATSGSQTGPGLSSDASNGSSLSGAW